MDNHSKLKSMRLWSPNDEKTEERRLSEEVPVVLEYNCVTFAVMMASPTDLVDFSYGFSLTEGIIEKQSDIIYSQIKDAPKGKIAAIEINAHAFHRIEKYNRTLSGRTGCGLCGVEKLEHAIKELPELTSDLKIKPEIIHQAMNALKSQQHLNKETGGLRRWQW
jgi:FdhD protein